MSAGIVWASRAEHAQTDFRQLFWNEDRGVMDQVVPCEGTCNDHWIYWWHAHVMDVLVDELERTGSDVGRESFMEQVLHDTIRWNGGTLLHNYYDDMEWMALALLRAYDRTGNALYKQGALDLWDDIKIAWNDHMGGGMAWKKDQLDYKNTPANAPASILAARLYRLDGRPEDLEWAIRIYRFNQDRLVDPETGFVWDGMNRLGDGEIDYDWKYTYCQGVFLGAGIELYRCTGDSAYLADAQRTARATVLELVNAETGMLPREGNDDCGLFKGILVRYLVNLIRIQPELAEPWIGLLRHNAEVLWEKGRSEAGLFSLSWMDQPEPVVQLSGQLSGIMLLEAMAALEREGFLEG
ncbi:putative alpha-1,6-mannanase (GH76 family) [Paenibacillus phyllosphaerae]|uniref:Putative alpha-1,6-mannanase (GH76 family) n=1 Tax=Paenibacillus phyllosphaerae TaxID=274593 RepID=A0A7W5B3W5_9BACL|nr:glycoside hydrolase family 76 protein [Paenibacillus phyllosphaerae]MBB3113930.1 putative alpha-1,6-mannanase (GH76 family) [Paenibacillus phyllosphaerae]